MIKNGTNMIDVKRNNRSLILQAISNDKVSRKDIAKKVHLTPASITILVNEFIKEGIILETGETAPTKKVGRKKTYIKLNEEYKYVFGVNIETDELSISVSNLYKELLDTITIPIHKANSKFILDEICTHINFLIKKFGLTNKTILGVGVGIVGNVDSAQGISKQAYGIFNEPIDLKSILVRRLGLEVVVDNNVRALALAETEQHKASSNLIFIKYGPGIGASLILDKEIYTGYTFNALEVGHFIVDVDGSTCLCGQSGCLETVGSYASLHHNVLIELKKGNLPKLENLCDKTTDFIPFDSMMEVYNNEPIIQQIARETIKYFAVGLINLVKILDTKSIVLYGTFFKNDSMFELLIETLNSLGCISSDRLTRSTLSDIKTVGAITLARKKLFFDRGAQKKG
jgi:predicted NBD/HSP70 family sugar kinase